MSGRRLDPDAQAERDRRIREKRRRRELEERKRADRERLGEENIGENETDFKIQDQSGSAIANFVAALSSDPRYPRRPRAANESGPSARERDAYDDLERGERKDAFVDRDGDGKPDAPAKGKGANAMEADEESEQEAEEEEAERREREAEERRRRLIDEAAARDTNKKYADDFGYSAEHKWIIWGLFKVVLYFTVLVAAFYVTLTDYKNKPCYIGETQTQMTICLRDDSLGLSCVGYEESACATFLQQSKSYEGCTKTYAGFDNTTKQLTYTIAPISNTLFEATCKDPFTCSGKDQASINMGITILGILYLVQVVVELVLIYALYSFSDKHYSEFLAPMTRHERLLLFLIKLIPVILQFSFIFCILVYLYFVAQVQYFASACQDILTVNGGPSLYPVYTYRFQLLMIAVLGLAGVCGTSVRLEKPLRGELYNPAPDVQRCECPGISCPTYQNRTSPKCCPEFFKACSKACCAWCEWFPMMIAYFVECLFAPILKCGWALGLMCRFRHFIGP